MSIDTVDSGMLSRLVRADQLSSIRRSVLTAIPVNVALGVAGMLVAINSGLVLEGVLWFVLSSAVNLGRIVLCRWPYPRSETASAGQNEAEGADHHGVERHLRLAWVSAFVSGLTWALVPILCEGYTSPQAVFYLTVVCGITAGSVTHAPAYAAVPMAFVAPPLLSAVGYLWVAGGFDNIALAVTVMLYLGALIRISRLSELGFRASSRLRNEATAMARSLRTAHARAEDVAQEMRRRSMHDGLTGLLNRDGFMQAAERLLAAPGKGRDAGPVPCMLLLDLDGFKAINDVFGHQVGDDALAGVGRLLQQELADEQAVAGRLGGDEFAILYVPRVDDSRIEASADADMPAGLPGSPGATDAANAPARALAARIIAAVSCTQVRKYGQFGVSIGICVERHAGVSDLLAFADAALYVAKRAGRNQFHIFDATLRRQLDRWRDAERDMAQAMQGGQGIEVWFQPILGDGGRRLDSLEALLRWKHPKHGWIPPEDMISVAAGTGQSEALLRVILAGVSECIRQLQAMGLAHVRVAMNISPREMSRLPVDDIVLASLREQGIATTSLEIEITEETALNIEIAESKLAALVAAHVRIAIDDFGVGYSSLASLRSEFMSRLKIDRSFVHDLAASRNNRVLVDAVLQLGRSLGVEVVAEGVETESDMRALLTLGCHVMQGYHLARPMPMADVLAWARGHAEMQAATEARAPSPQQPVAAERAAGDRVVPAA
ncbi:EAL domain-containing protein [Comamonadaceae bacterium PP-2]